LVADREEETHTETARLQPLQWLQYVREKVNHALTLDMMEVEKYEEYEREKDERAREKYFDEHRGEEKRF